MRLLNYVVRRMTFIPVVAFLVAIGFQVLTGGLPWAVLSAFVVLILAILVGWFIARQEADNIVWERVREFEELTHAARAKSIFSSQSFVQEPHSLWGKYAHEKAYYLGQLLDRDVKAPLLQKCHRPDKAFRLLCELSRELGAFITYFAEYLGKQGSFNGEKDWYSDYPVKAYHTYTDNLLRAAENLSRYYGNSVKRDAKRVDDSKPPAVRS